MYIIDRAKGFTLIELLIVIALIGLVSTIAVVGMRETGQKAKRAKADSDLQQILKAAVAAQVQNSKALKDITGSGCSACACNVMGCDYTCDACRNRMQTTMQSLGFPGAFKDPWGKYYVIDENEFEYPAEPCRADRAISPGYYKSIQIPFFSSCN